MIITNVLTLEESIYYIDFNTISVLICMMIVVSVVKNPRLFEYIAIYTAKNTKGDPWKIMISFIVITSLWNITLTIILILRISAIVSSFLTIATLITIIMTMQTKGIDVTPLWLATSLESCLGLNCTLIGASANVVFNIDENHRYEIYFKKYFSVVFPIMILTIIISTAYLLFRF